MTEVIYLVNSFKLIVTLDEIDTPIQMKTLNLTSKINLPLNI
jgi:hypothetical protein